MENHIQSIEKMRYVDIPTYSKKSILEYVGNIKTIKINVFAIEFIKWCIDLDYLNTLRIIYDFYIDDIYHLLYEGIIYSIVHNNTECIRLFTQNYSITDNLKSTIIISILKNYPIINIINVLKIFKIINLQKNVTDYLLEKVLFGQYHPKIIEIFNLFVQKVEDTPITRTYLSINKESQSNKELYSIVRDKYGGLINNCTWKTYCKIFNQLMHRDLILYLKFNNVHFYNGTPIEKLAQRQLCYLLRDKKITF